MKKNNGKILTSLFSLAVGATLLTGCGGGDAGGEGGDVQLELFSNKSENMETYEGLIAEFEEQNPTIDIELNAPPEAETVLKSRLTKNDMPDLMAIGGNATYGDLAEAGIFKDFSGSDYLEQIQPAYIDMINKLVGEETEGTYGIPYATNANTVIYNKDKLEELGLEVPKTWDEFVNALEEAKAAGEIPVQFTLKDAWTGMISWNSVAANIQPDNFAAKKSAGEASFQEHYSEVADKMLTLVEYGHDDNFGVGYSDGNTAFGNGEGVFYFQGNWAIPEIKKANPDINLGVFPMPVTNNPEENKLVSGVDVLFAMSTETEHEEEARKFIEFLLEQEKAKQYIDEQAAFSAVKGVLQEDPVMEGIKQNFEEGTITSFPDHYYPAGMQAANLIQAFLIEKNKDEFLKKLDNEWDKVENR
ncbi:extracellular solute-binding protein [Gracilibacillus sp. YIM 98692]|uniref:ABC transporter substrate-binding protein n=1 Tax=Gracilibacillus sp. YIM 98692 TaxID=2663532 RepID=UPI0013D7745F|nr:extracellular solute-binding protein [Gracilibacillus sp. YIM 98692]